MYVCGSTPLSLHVSMNDATIAQLSTPPSEPAKRAFFSIERNGADHALDDIGIDLDTSVVDEAHQDVPTREHIADRLGQLGLLADQRELFSELGLERVEDGARFFLSRITTLVRASPADFALDRVERR